MDTMKQTQQAAQKPWDTLTAMEKAPSLIEQLDEASERYTRYTNDPIDGLLAEAARVIQALSTTAPAVGAPVAWSREFEIECDNIDIVLRHIGLDPDQCRTDGGALNVERIKTLLVPKEGTPEDQEFLRNLYLEVTRNGKVLTDQKRGLEEFSERAKAQERDAARLTGLLREALVVLDAGTEDFPAVSLRADIRAALSAGGHGGKTT